MPRVNIPAGRIVLYILIILLFGLISFTFLRFRLYRGGLVSAQELYTGVKRSLDPSKANLVLDNRELTVSFKITPSDQAYLEALSKSLGVENFDNQNITIKLGDETAGFLDKTLKNNNLTGSKNKSINLNLRFLSKEIDFDNKKIFGPFDPPEADLLENPLLEGSIKVLPLGAEGYFITIDNPEKVMLEASTSGKLKLSEELTGSKWWQLLSKLAKIKLKIDNGEVSGAVILK